MGILSRLARFATACVLALGLTSCGGIELFSGEPAKIYDLSPKSTFDEGLPTVKWQLVVEEPVAGRAIDTDRIAVRRQNFEFGYFSGVRWSDRAPRMIQTRLVESFENSGTIVAVGRQAIGLRGDYDLKSELREFQVDFPPEGGLPVVLVRINAKIVEQPSANIIASQTFEREVEAASESFPDIVRAWDEALGGVMKRLVGWTVVSAEEHRLMEAEERRKERANRLQRSTPGRGR